MNNIDVLLITSDYIKKNSTIIDNVENTLITQHIYEAQNIDLQPCLGEDLYTYFYDTLDGWVEGDDTETMLGADYYKLLVDYMIPFITYKTVYYSFYDLYAKITAKGVVNQSGQNSATAEIKVLENMRKETNIKAEYYKNQLTAYLNDNSTLFSEYSSTCTCTDSDYCDCGNGCNTNAIYTGGLYLGKTEW